jgi:hypothetical protein
MRYDHSECAESDHDRRPPLDNERLGDKPPGDDPQPVDADGLIVCNDCGAAMFWCATFGYDHVDPKAPPCFLIGADVLWGNGYVAAVERALASGTIVEPADPHFCPECGEHVPPDADFEAAHVYTSSGVLVVGCEGYFVIDPNTVGIAAAGWTDWRDTPTEFPDLPRAEPSMTSFAAFGCLECVTCGARSQWVRTDGPPGPAPGRRWDADHQDSTGHGQFSMWSLTRTAVTLYAGGGAS